MNKPNTSTTLFYEKISNKIYASGKYRRFSSQGDYQRTYDHPQKTGFPHVFQKNISFGTNSGKNCFLSGFEFYARQSCT